MFNKNLWFLHFQKEILFVSFCLCKLYSSRILHDKWNSAKKKKIKILSNAPLTPCVYSIWTDFFFFFFVHTWVRTRLPWNIKWEWNEILFLHTCFYERPKIPMTFVKSLLHKVSLLWTTDRNDHSRPLYNRLWHNNQTGVWAKAWTSNQWLLTCPSVNFK